MKLKGKAYTSLINGSDTWSMEVEHVVMLERNEISMIRLMCGFMLKERNKNSEVREVTGTRTYQLGD